MGSVDYETVMVPVRHTIEVADDFCVGGGVTAGRRCRRSEEHSYIVHRRSGITVRADVEFHQIFGILRIEVDVAVSPGLGVHVVGEGVGNTVVVGDI